MGPDEDLRDQEDDERNREDARRNFLEPFLLHLEPEARGRRGAADERRASDAGEGRDEDALDLPHWIRYYALEPVIFLVFVFQKGTNEAINSINTF